MQHLLPCDPILSIDKKLVFDECLVWNKREIYDMNHTS